MCRRSRRPGGRQSGRTWRRRMRMLSARQHMPQWRKSRRHSPNNNNSIYSQVLPRKRRQRRQTDSHDLQRRRRRSSLSSGVQDAIAGPLLLLLLLGSSPPPPTPPRRARSAPCVCYLWHPPVSSAASRKGAARPRPVFSCTTASYCALWRASTRICVALCRGSGGGHPVILLCTEMSPYRDCEPACQRRSGWHGVEGLSKKRQRR